MFRESGSFCYLLQDILSNVFHLEYLNKLTWERVAKCSGNLKYLKELVIFRGVYS